MNLSGKIAQENLCIELGVQHLSDEEKSKIEVWRHINGFEDYEISNLGQVKKDGYFLKFDVAKNKGKTRVSLRKNKKDSKFTVSRLVLDSFVCSRPNNMEACHENGNPRDNRLSNLRWDTHINNEKDKIKHGTLLFGEKHQYAKLTEEKVKEIRELRRKGATIMSLANKCGIDFKTCRSALLGITWKRVA